MLETLFGSKLRAKILGRLFTRSGERYFVRQLAAAIGEDSTNVSRELARLEQAGLLVSITEGRQKYYQADPKSPLFKDIRGLMSHLPAAQPDSNALLRRRLKINQPELTGFCRLNHVQKLSRMGPSCVLTSNRRVTSMCLWNSSRENTRIPENGRHGKNINMIGGRKVTCVLHRI